MPTNWIVYGGLAFLVVFALSLYNRLVVLRNRVKNGWAQIDVQLKRRHDLIPNLLESVKAYLAHEKGVIEAVTQARQQAMAAGGDLQARMAAENALTSSVRSLFAVAEAYPQLRSSENMANFQEELGSTENRIAFARQHYNDAVLAYNTALETVPSNVVAAVFAFRPEPLFVTDAAERELVKVKF